MGRYRIYPSKNTTIIEDSPTINTGENQVMELWYGNSGLTRHLVKFDTDDYTSKYNDGKVPHITASTATTHFYNCYPIFEETSEYSSAVHASSVDLILQMVQQDWDEGNGFDFYGLNTNTGYADWYSATSSSAWAAAGGDFLYTVFSGHIDKGTENFSGTVTNEIALWDMFTGNNFGLAIMYSGNHEALSSATRNVLKYYTRHTNTYYKPYIQLDWDNQVRDERHRIYSGLTNRLYLYIKNNGEFSNANSVSSVTMTFSDDSTHTGFTGTGIYNPMPGIYYVNFDCPNNCTAATITDTWAVQYEDSMPFMNIAQTGTTQTTLSQWTTGGTSNIINPIDYDISIPGLQSEYYAGAIVYLEINNLTKYTSTKNVVKNMEYKIYLKDGNNKFIMEDWDGVSYTQDDNFIMIDTTWYLTGNTYGLQFRYNTDGSTVYVDQERTFKVV